MFTLLTGIHFNDCMIVRLTVGPSKFRVLYTEYANLVFKPVFYLFLLAPCY